MVNMMKSIYSSDSSVDMRLQGEAHVLGSGSKDAPSKGAAPVLSTNTRSRHPAVSGHATATGASAVAKGAGALTSIEGKTRSSQGNVGKSSSAKARGERPESDAVSSPGAHAPLPMPQGCDVLFGAVTKQRWPGNALFNKLVQQRRKSTEKEASAAEIARIVRRRGGTFFYCGREHGKLLYVPCTEEQTIKYTMRHLQGGAKSKLFSASTASYLQTLYSTQESSSSSHVEPWPLEVKSQMVGVLLSDADPSIMRAATAGAAERTSGTTARPPTIGPSVAILPSKSHRGTKPPSGMFPPGYPHPYYQPHYPPPSYSYYPYQYYPQYQQPSSAYSSRASAALVSHVPSPKEGVRDDPNVLPEPDPNSAESVDSSHAPSAVISPSQEGEVKVQLVQQSLANAPNAAETGHLSEGSASKESLPPSPLQPPLPSPSSSSQASSPASSASASASPSMGGRQLLKAPLHADAVKGDDVKSSKGASAMKVPKGVTVRPSGKWQAQFYFFGKSRYVGVYETALQASVAYSAALHLSQKYKELIRDECLDRQIEPREEAERLLAAARTLGMNAAVKFQEALDMAVNTKLDNSSSGGMQTAEAAFDSAMRYIETEASKVYQPFMKCDAIESGRKVA